MVQKLFCVIFVLLCSICWANSSRSQDSTVYDLMSLDELCDVNVVVTASKKPEDLFEAPLSVTIIKKEDIVKAGCRNIMEALRLSPGLIVRETSPGNFDVHIRGFDDASKNFYIPLPFNSNTLVMIDYRIVFSYFSGGTLWETLPIGIQDIERIEVVRGPASALYGPNAVNGVINIITSQAKEPGLNTFAHAAWGTQSSKITNASVGYNWSDKTKVNFSANYSERYRFDNKYYSWLDNKYVNWDDLGMLMDIMKDTITREVYTPLSYKDTLNASVNQELSYRNASANVFFSHITCRNRYDVSLGTHHSQSQKPGAMNFLTPFSESRSNSVYFDTHVSLGNFNAQINVIDGEDISNFAFNSHKYTVFNASMEYNWQVFKSLNLRPGLNFRNVEYYSPIINREPFDFAKMNYQFSDTFREVENNAFYLLTEWKPLPKLRFIGGLRADTFNLERTGTFNYELAATYRINKDNQVRFVNSKASRAPFIFDTYLNSKNEFDAIAGEGAGEIRVPIKSYFVTEKKLKYPTNNTFEIGWRSKINSFLEIDIELFTSYLTNVLVSMNRESLDQKLQLDSKGNVVDLVGIKGVSTIRAENFNVSSRQNGVSFIIGFRPNEKTSLSFYTSLQSTKMYGYNKSSAFVKRDTASIMDTVTNIFSQTSNTLVNISAWSGETTPTMYGGFTLNYIPKEKWNFNITGYYYTKQQYFQAFDEVKAGYFLNVDPWINMNMKVSYEPYPKLKLYVSAYNLLGKHREFWGADEIGTSVFFGVQWGY